MTFHEQDRRANIPTSELGSFMKDEQKAPQKVLYPRDPSLDPQLVWKGKDEQDSAPLEVDAVPIYIQEKVQPKALIEDLRAEQEKIEPQATLFANFNGITFEQMVDFYQHPQNWSNRLILGDSLRVMTSLAEKEGLKGQVQMIYVDPPYGIKFGSNWQVSTRKREVTDGRVDDVTRQPEQVKAFRDTWELGIHSYLAYLRDRLLVARELLSDKGSLFLQIGDENAHLVRSVLDEVFGSECQVVTLVVKKKGSQRSTFVDPVNDYILWYSKKPRTLAEAGPTFRQLFAPRLLDAETLGEFRSVELPDGSNHPLRAVPTDGTLVDYSTQPDRLFAEHPKARLFRPWPITNGGERANQMDPVELNGREYLPPPGRCWSHTSRSTDGSLTGMDKVKLARRLVASGNALDFKRYLDDFRFKVISNWWDGLGGAANPIYVVQTNTELVKRCLLMTTDPGDLVLDPTCGSGTTAFVAEQWGRRWITIDTSRVALALARQRLMAAKYPYYVLSDTKTTAANLAAGDAGESHGDVSKGFVYKTAPRITSGSIANNPDVQPGLSREEMDAAIVKHAEEVTLYDQPDTDNKVVRVSGPFTVESLSPHIGLPGEGQDMGNAGASDENDVLRFHRIVLDHLRRSGVQNTVRSERLMFETLEPWAGICVHAVGDYRENGEVKRAAISIGPEYGTVDTDYVVEAAKEASVFVDLLIVCGFAFDGYIAGEFKQLGNLTILKAAINPDLAMGDELLKKTGSANLFTVFGEPDIDVRKHGEGEWVVEVRGIDVYDPTTGEIRSHSTDDIACWFIDTDYDRASFFVRHAYFLGATDPYNQLKRALRADIDETVWASLYSTISRPFSTPKRGRIAVKVINHYGDEVTKVYAIP